MNTIFNATEEELMKGIIADENWTTAPDEEIFYNTLESVLNNTDQDYKNIVMDFIDMIKKHKYHVIKDEVSELIKSM